MEINEIRTIFLKYWDPILIGDNELLIDEYDNYVNSMFDYLKGDNIDIDELYTFLDTVYHEIPDIFSAPIISTAFKRLIRFYDWLKFGRS